MKYFIPLLLIMGLVSCSDDSDGLENLGQTEADIIEHLESNNIDATRTTNGVYYVIDEQGEGEFPADDAYVKIYFTGYFLDGEQFGTSGTEESVTIDLVDVISGFSEGIQNFNTGSKGTLYIPPSQAFGDSGSGNIPGGAVLIYDIEVLEITNAQTEDDIIEYLDENDLEAERSSTGLYYIVEEEGAGEEITQSSIVTLTYTGYYLNGEEFDSGDNVQFDLSQVISGFAEGITYFKEGGKGKLLLPPDLAYGDEEVGDIPRSSVLIFDIEVISLDY